MLKEQKLLDAQNAKAYAQNVSQKLRLKCSDVFFVFEMSRTIIWNMNERENDNKQHVREERKDRNKENLMRGNSMKAFNEYDQEQQGPYYAYLMCIFSRYDINTMVTKKFS